MQPFRIARSEAEVEQLAVDSLICPPYCPESVYQKSAPNEWVEPGSEDTTPTAAVWEWMTGAYEELVLDEDREVWVIYDASAPRPAQPPRPADSPDYATRMQSRTPEHLTHATLEEARAAIETEIGDGISVGHTNIWKRTKDTTCFRAAGYVSPGTSAAELPWRTDPA